MRRPDFECWPDLRITLHLPPWAWRLKPWLYVDDNGARSHWSASWLFLVVEWWGQDPGHALFPMRDEMEHLLGAGRGIDPYAERPSTDALLDRIGRAASAVSGTEEMTDG